MKYKEALSWFTKKGMFAKSTALKFYSECAISALEKQIPKKVVEKKFVEDVSLNYCPCCNVRFIGWGMKHCGECGQALDWENVDKI